jgi:hypothetical protein
MYKNKETVIKELRELFDIENNLEKGTSENNGMFRISKQQMERSEVLARLRNYFNRVGIEEGFLSIGSITFIYTTFEVCDGVLINESNEEMKDSVSEKGECLLCSDHCIKNSPKFNACYSRLLAERGSCGAGSAKVYDFMPAGKNAFAVYPDSKGFDFSDDNTLMAVFRNEQQAHKFARMMWGSMYFVEPINSPHFL